MLDFVLGHEHPVRQLVLAGTAFGIAVGFVAGIWMKAWIDDKRERLDAYMGEAARQREAADPLSDTTVRIISPQRPAPVVDHPYDWEAER